MRGLIKGALVHLQVHGDGVLECVPYFLIEDSINYIGCMSNICDTLSKGGSEVDLMLLLSSSSHFRER